MANFDANTWYRMYISNAKESVYGTGLFSRNLYGAVFNSPANSSSLAQKWQFYAMGSGYYTLRSGEGGQNGFLATEYSADEANPGHTQVCVTRGNISDESVYWRIEPWKDGTFFMWNKKNESSWHFAKNGSTALMDSNVTAPQEGQRFSFEVLGNINNKVYSTVDLPSATVTAPSTVFSTSATTTSSPTSNLPLSSSSTTSPPSTSASLSTATKVAISASVSIAFIVAFVVIALLFLRKRKQKNLENLAEADHSTQKENGCYPPGAHEMPSQNKFEMDNEGVAVEMPWNERTEMPGSESGSVNSGARAELPSSPLGRGR